MSTLVDPTSRQGEEAMEALTIERSADVKRQDNPLGKRQTEVRAAVERVYRKYGNNLSAFYRDARKESQKEVEKRKR